MRLNVCFCVSALNCVMKRESIHKWRRLFITFPNLFINFLFVCVSVSFLVSLYFILCFLLLVFLLFHLCFSPTQFLLFLTFFQINEPKSVNKNLNDKKTHNFNSKLRENEKSRIKFGITERSSLYGQPICQHLTKTTAMMMKMVKMMRIRRREISGRMKSMLIEYVVMSSLNASTITHAYRWISTVMQRLIAQMVRMRTIAPQHRQFCIQM